MTKTRKIKKTKYDILVFAPQRSRVRLLSAVAKERNNRRNKGGAQPRLRLIHVRTRLTALKRHNSFSSAFFFLPRSAPVEENFARRDQWGPCLYLPFSRLSCSYTSSILPAFNSPMLTTSSISSKYESRASLKTLFPNFNKNPIVCKRGR